MVTVEAPGWVTHPWVAAGRGRLRFGVQLWRQPAEWPVLLDTVQLVEALGFDSVWIADHPMVGRADCWTTLAALAARTSTIRLGSLVSCVYYRHPALLARMAADVDRISAGRLVLGMGIGDLPGEFAQLGLRFPAVAERQGALEDALRIVAGLWRGTPFTHDGADARVREAVCAPGPVQQPRVPVLIAGGGERVTLRQVARHADASNFGALAITGGAVTLADVARKHDVLRRHCEEIGRPYESVLRSHHTYPLVLAETGAAVAAKLGRIPADELERLQPSRFAGTPREAIAHFHALMDAGVQYVIAVVRDQDAETIRLLGERVVPETTAS